MNLLPLVCMVTILACLFATGCSARPVQVLQDKSSASLWTMSNGEVELAIDLTKNRISSYSFRGGRNVLWVNPKPEDVPADSTPGPNWGGDRVWVWPQRYWNWPPPLPAGGYRVDRVEENRRLILISGVIAPYGVRVIREIELAPKGTAVTITTRFEPVQPGTTQPIAPWSVTQVPVPKHLLARIPDAKDRETFEHRKEDGFTATDAGNGFIEIKRHQPGSLKTFMDADILIAQYDNVIFTQRQLSAHREGTWAPAERCQIYQHSDDSFVELEWSSPMLAPDRVAQSPLRVVWSLSKP